jgi:hypothetical protein
VRKLFDVQLALGAFPIEKVELPTKTRDELPPTLAALQWIFITPDGRFHCMPVEDLGPTIALFRHRFLHALRDAKLISPSKLANLLAWKHSGFNIYNGGEQPVPAHDAAGRKRLAEPQRSGDRAPGGWPREG